MNDENEQLSKEIDRLKSELQREPNSADSALRLSELFLASGDYRRGWPLYSTRISHPSFSVISEFAEACLESFSQPPWAGQSLNKKTILIIQEQGRGDLFMVARYFPLLKEAGATVHFLVWDDELVDFFQRQPGVDFVSTHLESDILVDFDFWCLSFDLPLMFQTELDSIPPNCLRSDQRLVKKWQEKLPSPNQNKLRVGLVWKGNPDYSFDKSRSLPALSILSSLFNIPAVQFFSLQKGEGEGEAAATASAMPNFVHLGGELTDYAETAAIIENLDLVISSDTSVAHLAGALGKPVWLLTPGLNTCWRWMLSRTDSPWYPSMRLFRQSQVDAERADWSNVVSEIAIELQKLSVKILKKRRLMSMLNPQNWFSER